MSGLVGLGGDDVAAGTSGDVEEDISAGGECAVEDANGSLNTTMDCLSVSGGPEVRKIERISSSLRTATCEDESRRSRRLEAAENRRFRVDIPPELPLRDSTVVAVVLSVEPLEDVCVNGTEEG